MRPLPALLLLTIWLPGLAAGAVATTTVPVCRSPASGTPALLSERFLPAGCAACWRAPDRSPPGALTLDWIVPAPDNGAAPLGAAAVREAHDRLTALGLAAADVTRHSIARVDPAPPLRLVVAHGPVVGGYVGASMTLRLRPGARPAWPLTGWLLMVEELPAGTEGSPIARRLARNLLTVRWDDAAQPTFTESRPMGVPEGVKAERLGFVGWITDARGHTLAAARARCGP